MTVYRGINNSLLQYVRLTYMHAYEAYVLTAIIIVYFVLCFATESGRDYYVYTLSQMETMPQ